MTSIPPTAVQSPCIKLCVVEPESGYCIGCGRTREEIGCWIGYRAEQREAVMLELPARLANLTRNKQRKGRSSKRLRSQT